MSVVTLQIGQCGNQVGCEWFSTLAQEIQQMPADCQAEAWASFFREPGPKAKQSLPVARCVQVCCDSFVWGAWGAEFLLKVMSGSIPSELCDNHQQI